MNPGDSNPFDAFETINGGVAAAPPQGATPDATPQAPMMQQQQHPHMMQQRQQQQLPTMQQEHAGLGQQPTMMQHQQHAAMMQHQQQPTTMQHQQPTTMQHQQPTTMQHQQPTTMQHQQPTMMQHQEQPTMMHQQQPGMHPFQQQQIFQHGQEQQQNGTKPVGEDGGMNFAQSQTPPQFAQPPSQNVEKESSGANPFEIIVVSPEQQHQMIQQQQEQPPAGQPSPGIFGAGQSGQQQQQQPPTPQPFGQVPQPQDGHQQHNEHQQQQQMQPPFAAPPMPSERGQPDANPFMSMAIQPAPSSSPNQWSIPGQAPPQEQPTQNQQPPQPPQPPSDQDPFGGVFGPPAGTQPAPATQQNPPAQGPFDPSPQAPSVSAPGALVVATAGLPGQTLPGYDLGIPGSGHGHPPQPAGNPFGVQQQPSSDPFQQQPAGDAFGAAPQGQPLQQAPQPVAAPTDDPFGLFGAPKPPPPQQEQQQQPPPPPPQQEQPPPPPQQHPQQQHYPEGHPPPQQGPPPGPTGNESSNDPNVMQAPGTIARTLSQNLARSAPSASSPLPDPDQVRSTGFIQSRISFRTILLKKWKQCYWVAYGPTVVYVFRSKEDGNDWLYNPYLTKSQREFLVKLRVDFQGDPANTKSIRGYRVTQMKRKGYGKQVLYNFKLERWMDYGPTIAAAFGSPDQKESEGLRNVLVECIRNSPQDPAIAAGAAASGGQVSVHGPAVPQPGQQALDEQAMQQFRTGGAGAAGAEASARRAAPTQGFAGASQSSYGLATGDDDTVAPYAQVNQRHARGVPPSSAASVSALDDDASIGGVSGVVSHVGDFSYARSGGFARGSASVAAIEDVLSRNPAPHQQQNPVHHQQQPPQPQQPPEFQGFYGGNPGISGVPPGAPPTPGQLAPIAQGQPFQQQQHQQQFMQQQFQQQQHGYPPNAHPQQPPQFQHPY